MSIAEDTIGTLSAISLVTRVRVSAWLGSTEDSAGPQQDVVEGQAEWDFHQATSWLRHLDKAMEAALPQRPRGRARRQRDGAIAGRAAAKAEGHPVA